MTATVVAYIPVLHEGYVRFLTNHAEGGECLIPSRDLYADYRPLAKDVRALDPEAVVAAVRALGICERVELLTPELAAEVAADGRALILPDEDVSHQIVERYFPRSPVSYSPTFLRWDKNKTVQLREPRPDRMVGPGELVEELGGTAEQEAERSADWWRQVGAAMRLASGELISAANRHDPHQLAPYAVGDPRSNFYRGVHLELSTATHAEARVIAEAARRGLSTEGADLYVTDFPCPPCSRLIAGAGIKRLYFGKGYAVLDGEEIMSGAGVEIVGVEGLVPG